MTTRPLTSHWRQRADHVIRRVLATLPKPPPVPPCAVTFRFTPLPGLPEQHLAFCRAMAASPADDAPRLIFADSLEERGEGRAAGVRSPTVDENAVAKRLFGKWACIVHGSHGREIAGRHVRLMDARLITEHLDGTALLVLPDLMDAIRAERTAAALRLFGTVRETK